MRYRSLALATLLATSAFSAHAGYTTIDYTGTVSRIYAADGGPSAPADIFVGQMVYFSVSVDLSQFVSFGTFVLPDGKTGAPLVVHPAGVSLFYDPQATYTISIGSHVWTQADDTDEDDGYVEVTGDARAAKPLLTYDGLPSQLIGLSQNAINAEGLDFNSSPGDYFTEDARYPVYGGSIEDGGFGFAVNTSLDQEIQTLRAAALAAGQVPEPATGALLLLGGMGLAVSRRRARATGAGFRRLA